MKHHWFFSLRLLHCNTCFHLSVCIHLTVRLPLIKFKKFNNCACMYWSFRNWIKLIEIYVILIFMWIWILCLINNCVDSLSVLIKLLLIVEHASPSDYVIHIELKFIFVKLIQKDYIKYEITAGYFRKTSDNKQTSRVSTFIWLTDPLFVLIESAIISFSFNCLFPLGAKRAQHVQVIFNCCSRNFNCLLNYVTYLHDLITSKLISFGINREFNKIKRMTEITHGFDP